MDDPMNDSEWKVSRGTQYDGSPVIIWTEIYGDGIYVTRRLVYFFGYPRHRAYVVSRGRSGSHEYNERMTIDELLREPYITDEIRSYIAQLQN